jgi:acetylornithine deacetylase/succinyl-diaminopimelate desuccinylase-like protein
MRWETTLRRVTVVVLLLWSVRARADTIDWSRVGDEAVAHLQAYMRVDTTNPPGHETPAAELLRGWLAAEGIETQLYDPLNDPQRQALVARLPGNSGPTGASPTASGPTANGPTTSGRTLVLMSHSDVVPAVAGEWSHPPFAAEIAGGTLYGRGALDTKGLGILQLTTLLLLHRQGLTPRDDILLLIEPDEEEHGRGAQGMLAQHAELFGNVRMVLNEGGSGTRDLLKPGQVIFFVQTAEKGAAWMKLTARGDTGHGSVPLPNNAVVTMVRALDRIAKYETPLRPSKAVVGLFNTLADELPFPSSFVMHHVDSPIVQTLFRSRLTERPLINAMLRTTISLTGVHGGYKTNVIPSQVDATLDCRVTVGDSGDALKRELERVVDDPRVTIELDSNGTPNESPVDDTLMAIIRTASGQQSPGSSVAPLMSSGVTDSAFFRRRGIAAYGFNPTVVTERELESTHGIDERMSVEAFRDAVRTYYEVVSRLVGADSGR